MFLFEFSFMPEGATQPVDINKCILRLVRFLGAKAKWTPAPPGKKEWRMKFSLKDVCGVNALTRSDTLGHTHIDSVSVGSSCGSSSSASRESVFRTGSDALGLNSSSHVLSMSCPGLASSIQEQVGFRCSSQIHNEKHIRQTDSNLLDVMQVARFFTMFLHCARMLRRQCMPRMLVLRCNIYQH
jgi:hypothetical protein